MTGPYDFLYKELTAEDREALRKKCSDAITGAMKDAEALIAAEVAKVVTALYREYLVVNPWPKLIDEHSSEYEFINAIFARAWELITTTNPTEHNEYTMKRAMEAWSEKFPDDFKKIADEFLISENKRLTESLEFWQRANRH